MLSEIANSCGNFYVIEQVDMNMQMGTPVGEFILDGHKSKQL